MLKPKYVHRLNDAEATTSVLHRLTYESSYRDGTVTNPPTDDTWDNGGLVWTFTLG